MKHINYQDSVNKLADFVELRFGVYLDTVSGFKHNLERFNRQQQQAAQLTKIPIEELDKIPLTRGKGPPSSNLTECKRLELHSMLQGDFKKNNSLDGVNYNFAIENCLSDIFNYWNAMKEKLKFKKTEDVDLFPVMAYMRELRNRVQHDLYPNRVVTQSGGPIIIARAIFSYTFPIFEAGKSIRLSESDIEALIFEVRAQINAILIPYLNDFLRKKAPVAT